MITLFLLTIPFLVFLALTFVKLWSEKQNTKAIKKSLDEYVALVDTLQMQIAEEKRKKIEILEEKEKNEKKKIKNKKMKIFINRLRAKLQETPDNTIFDDIECPECGASKIKNENNNIKMPKIVCDNCKTVFLNQILGEVKTINIAEICPYCGMPLYYNIYEGFFICSRCGRDFDMEIIPYPTEGYSRIKTFIARQTKIQTFIKYYIPGAE